MIDARALEFHAMGSPCRVVVGGGSADLAEQARDLVLTLERRWSRFDPASEISALNRIDGRVAVVSEPTFRLLSCAARAQQATDGRFNPFMLDQLEAHGYRRPWNDETPVPSNVPVGPATERAMTLFHEASAVELPGGCRFDPGGIGKGLAIDLAVELCLAQGATTVSVELGGDLRVHGQPWYGPSWEIGVVDPFDRDRNVSAFTLHEGAVTTSTTRRRAWTGNGKRFHHLLDPATGMPSGSDLVAVTTCSSEAWWAEVAAKAALLVGSDRVVDALNHLGTPGIAVAVDGLVLRTDDEPALAAG